MHFQFVSWRLIWVSSKPLDTSHLNNHRHLTHPLSHPPSPTSWDKMMRLCWWNGYTYKVHYLTLNLATWPQKCTERDFGHKSRLLTLIPKMARWCIGAAAFVFWCEFWPKGSWELAPAKVIKDKRIRKEVMASKTFLWALDVPSSTHPSSNSKESTPV